VIVVAGHLCLDLAPTIHGQVAIEPGALVEVGGAAFSAGGAVANVGLALARLGLEPTLLARVGRDPLGEILRDQLTRAAPDGVSLALTEAEGESTSYSIVISPPGRDRTFLHHPGCNDTFSAQDLRADRWARAELLHFGYPPLMRAIYDDGGNSLAAEFARLRKDGVTVSLDMAMPDRDGLSGKVDWAAFLARVLPHVDLFLPSWQEIAFMLEPGRPSRSPRSNDLARIAERLLEHGPALVALKLGEDGLYLRTADSVRLEAAGRAAPGADWADRELLSPNFSVVARGTTGAGDATIAGLLAALAQRLPIAEAATMASAVGAFSVEGATSVSGLRSWDETRQRVASGWARAESGVVGPHGGASDWRVDPATGVLAGTNDVGGNG
jgi:sugar/nucleoside kinase (ribokinase family)